MTLLSPQPWRSRFLCFAVLHAIVLLADVTQADAQSRQRPNILWIVAENFSNDFGCYGQQNVATPNIDALAEAGVRYTNAFSTSPVCAPSRSCFMLGMYQTTTGTHHMRSHRDDDFRLPEGIRPLTHRLRDAGYFTANLTHIISAPCSARASGRSAGVRFRAIPRILPIPTRR